MRLLIIGGTGFFGKTFIDAFVDNYLAQWKVKELILISRSKTFFYDIDIKKLPIKHISSSLEELDDLPKCDYILNFATSSNEGLYISNPEKERLAIINQAHKFVELVYKYNHNKLKILYTSSGAVYGPSRKKILFTEDDVATDFFGFSQNKAAYAKGKIEAEKILTSIKSSNHNIVIARCFSFLGRWLPINGHFAVGNFFKNIFFDNKITVKTNQNVLRSYMSSVDLVTWLMTMLVNQIYENLVFNVGSHDAISIQDLAILLSKLFDKPVDFECDIDLKVCDSYLPDISKSLKTFNLEKPKSLENIISEYHELMIKNNFYKNFVT